jgi:hypothetical protein
MDKFSTFSSLNYHICVSRSKYFVRSGMGIIDSILAFKDHSDFQYNHDNIFHDQIKVKVLVFKMSVDL